MFEFEEAFVVEVDHQVLLVVGQWRRVMVAVMVELRGSEGPRRAVAVGRACAAFQGYKRWDLGAPNTVTLRDGDVLKISRVSIRGGSAVVGVEVVVWRCY